MNSFKIFILFCILPSLSFALNLENSWDQVKSELDQKIWINKQNDNMIVSAKTIEASKSFNFKNYQDNIVKHKRRALSFLGANNWTKKKVFHKKNRYFISGHYTDNEQKRVQFLELHLLEKKKGKLKVVVYTVTDSHETLEYHDLKEQMELFSEAI